MKRWPLHNAWFWESAPFFRVLLPVVAGIVGYKVVQHYQIPVVGLLIAAIISGVVFMYTAFAKVGKAVNAICFASFNIMVVTGMLSLCWLNDVRNDSHPIGIDSTGHTLVRVATIPAVKEKTTRLTVQGLSTLTNVGIQTTTGNAYLYVWNDDSLNIHEGDTILVPNHWQPITNRGNPFEYDYAAYCARNNLYYRQFADADDMHIVGRNKSDPGIVAQCHNWCMKQLAANIPDEEVCGLMQAMLLGDETNLDDNLRQAWAQTGIIHFIAISGGNITMLFFIIAGLLWWLRHRRHLWVKYLVALPVIWLYVVIAGAPPSAMRAAVMFTILALSLLLQRNNNSLNTLFAAATLLLVAQPMWLFAAGFQLSFVAILSLILFYSPIYSLYIPSTRIGLLLWGTVVSSLAVEILVAPLIIWYFYLFPLPFLVSNLLAFVFMNIVLILGIVLLIFSFIPIIAHAVGWLVVWFTTCFNDVIFWMQHLSPASFNYLYLNGCELLLVYCTITGIALFVLRQYKPGIFIALGSMCVLLLLMCMDEYTALHQQRFVAYNMGNINQMEVIKGKQNTIVNTDIHTLALQKDYVLKAPHAVWHAWQVTRQDTDNEIYLVNGKSFLLLNQPVHSGSFPVDYLIVDIPPGKVHPAQLMQVFHPSTIVFGSNYTAKQAAKWLDECNTLHQSAWHTGTQGALIYGY